MKRRFKAKKKKDLKIRYFVFLFILFILFQFLYSIFMKIQLTTTNEEFIQKLLNDSNHHLKYEKKTNILEPVFNFFMDVDLTKPQTLLEKSFKYEYKEVTPSSDGETSMLEFHYIKDPTQEKIQNPVVYIYNSHQAENYSTKNYENYGITPNVMMASYLLKDKLNSFGISTIAEEGNIIEFMKMNNWTHAYSYVASRYYIEDTMKKNPNLKLLIDLHRDSIRKKDSTVTIDGKDYAKILFVVGLENKNYQKNLQLAETLNNKIKEKYPTLTRGIIKKEGMYVDGVYNQDLSPNMILLEVGGYENLVSEVNNTIDILSIIIKEYMEEQ